jgi:AAA+ superfamily predicted ATPase
VLLICATNRKRDLDLAMLSRIDLSVTFSLPDKQSRVEIFKRYAKQLDEKDLNRLAAETEEFSGRNISDMCKSNWFYI